MAKNVIEDIVAQKRLERREAFFNKTKNSPPGGREGGAAPHLTPPGRRRNLRPTVYAAAGIIAAVLFFAFFILSGRPRVELLVVPRSEDAAIDVRGRASVQSDEQIAAYDVMSVSHTAARELDAVGEREVNRRATGEILVFNNHSTESQRLVARTRFETSAGLVYRSPDPITIPGAQVTNGERVPGSVRIKVVADEPGPEYNIETADFRLPGLGAGNEIYNNIYARSAASMTGGFSGVEKTVDDAARENARTEMFEELRTAVLAKAREAQPESRVGYPDTFSIRFAETLQDTDAPQGNNAVTLSITASMDVATFERDEFMRYILETTELEEWEDAFIANLDELDFRVLGDSPLDLAALPDFSFAVSGTGHVVWRIPRTAIQEALAGAPKEKEAYQSIFSLKFPNIVEARVLSWSPFWADTFPGDPRRISIFEEEP